MTIRFSVKHTSGKNYRVVECFVTPSDQEPEGHYQERRFVSCHMSYDDAHAFCNRRNEEEIEKEKRGCR